MQEWEYTLFVLTSKPGKEAYSDDFLVRLNESGREGWEVVCQFQDGLLLLKRKTAETYR